MLRMTYIRSIFIFFKKAQNNDCATSLLNRKVILLNDNLNKQMIHLSKNAFSQCSIFSLSVGTAR